MTTVVNLPTVVRLLSWIRINILLSIVCYNYVTFLRAFDYSYRIIRSQLAKRHNESSSVLLLRLPAEIRNRIYHYAVPRYRELSDDLKGRLWWMRSFDEEDVDRPGLHVEPAILRTCRLLRSDKLPLYYGRHFFRYKDLTGRRPVKDLESWLNKLGAHRIRHTRYLSIHVEIKTLSLTVRLKEGVCTVRGMPCTIVGIDGTIKQSMLGGICVPISEVEKLLWDILRLIGSYYDDQHVLSSLRAPLLMIEHDWECKSSKQD